MYDILIKNGTVIDGTGAPMFAADVAVQDGKIATVGDLAHEAAHDVYDASGKYVTPGFIDVNNHSDAYWNIFTNPTLDSLLHQGVTTVIGGNSGASLAPLLAPDAIKGVQKWTDVSHVNVNWRTMGEFLDTVQKRALSLNFGTLVGHATLRRALVYDEQRAVTEEELAQMEAMLDNALRDGALGLSVALLYAHARSATYDELTRLAKVVAAHDGVFVVYLSDEMDGVMDALEQNIAIAREAGVRLHIAHVKTVGRKNWSLMHDVLTVMQSAREGGLSVTGNVYPYTTMSAVLYTLLPQWVTDGGRAMMLARLRDSETRTQVIAQMREQKCFDLDNAFISVASIVGHLAQRRIGAIAQAQETTVEDVVIDLLLASNGHVIVLLDALGEESVCAALADASIVVASNGGGYKEDDWRSGDSIHPRSFGAFARFLGHYVRDEMVVSWERAIKKVTSLPADSFGLAQRGVLAPEMIADITVFDPQTIADRATLQEPYRYATGVDAVVCNGMFALRDGVVTSGTGSIVHR